MPNHWESSARPLFVKTVFINGSRHAILFEKDPLIRCVSSPHKKTSRPNSSLSFLSGLSISSKESQNSECKTFGLGQSQGKNLSSELQNCLVKFKLNSNGLRNYKKSGVEKCFYDSKAKKNLRQKTQVENRDSRCEYFFEEEQKFTPTETINNQEKSCYIYNLENYKRRKNYSFVKITSQSPQFLVNCSCKDNSEEAYNCNSRNKHNLVISASIKNLVMTPTENESLVEKTLEYVLPFENSELHWNYLTKSYYSSLAERVFQWIDLTRKQKKPTEKINLTEPCNTSSERICSGEKFAKAIKKNEDLCKFNKNSNNKKNSKHIQGDTSEEEIEEKVIREQNVETLLSLEEIKNDSQDVVGDETRRLDILDSLKNFSQSEKSNSTTIFNLVETPFKVEDLFVNSPSKETTKTRKKIKDRRSVSSRQSKDKETSHNEQRNFSITEGSDFVEKADLQCYSKRNLDTDADDLSSQILTEFAERKQKSINNLNNTRTSPVLIQNLSPQQHDKISSSEEENIVWASEKSTGRPQLHIFMPIVLLKDQSDDSMSECETFLNL